MGKYEYIYRSGGYVGYKGTSADIKPPLSIRAEITDDTLITVTTEYADGNVRMLKCGFTEDDSGITLTKVRKYWNDEVMI